MENLTQLQAVSDARWKIREQLCRVWFQLQELLYTVKSAPICLQEKEMPTRLPNSQVLPQLCKLVAVPGCPRRLGQSRCDANWVWLCTGRKEEDCMQNPGNTRAMQRLLPVSACGYRALWFSDEGELSPCPCWVLMTGDVQLIKLWTSGMKTEHRMTVLVSWIKKSHYWVVIFREEMPNA